MEPNNAQSYRISTNIHQRNKAHTQVDSHSSPPKPFKWYKTLFMVFGKMMKWGGGAEHPPYMTSTRLLLCSVKQARNLQVEAGPGRGWPQTASGPWAKVWRPPHLASFSGTLFLLMFIVVVHVLIPYKQ